MRTVDKTKLTCLRIEEEAQKKLYQEFVEAKNSGHLRSRVEGKLIKYKLQVIQKKIARLEEREFFTSKATKNKEAELLRRRENLEECDRRIVKLENNIAKLPTEILLDTEHPGYKYLRRELALEQAKRVTFEHSLAKLEHITKQEKAINKSLDTVIAQHPEAWELSPGFEFMKEIASGVITRDEAAKRETDKIAAIMDPLAVINSGHLEGRHLEEREQNSGHLRESLEVEVEIATSEVSISVEDAEAALRELSDFSL